MSKSNTATRYAIVSDRTPTRCTIVEIVETEQDMLDVSRERDIPLSRIMWVSEQSTAVAGDRAWHADETVA